MAGGLSVPPGRIVNVAGRRTPVAPAVAVLGGGAVAVAGDAVAAVVGVAGDVVAGKVVADGVVAGPPAVVDPGDAVEREPPHPPASPAPIIKHSASRLKVRKYAVD